MGIRQVVLLSAFLLTDGGISSKGDKWLIYFRNKDDFILEEFNKILKVENNKIWTSKRNDGTTFIRVVDNKLANKLFELSPSFRTKACNTFPICQHLTGKLSRCNIVGTVYVNNIEYPKVQLPSILFMSKRLACNFLKIYASCDGGVSVSLTKNKKKSYFLVRKVLISVKHPVLSDQITRLLKHLDFQPSQYKDQIRLVKKKDIIRFHKQVGFINGCKVSNDSKYFCGIEKNQLLNMVIKSFDIPKYLVDILKQKSFSSGLSRD